MLLAWLYRNRDPVSYAVAAFGCLLALVPQSLLTQPKVVKRESEIVAMLEMPPNVSQVLPQIAPQPKTLAVPTPRSKVPVPAHGQVARAATQELPGESAPQASSTPPQHSQANAAVHEPRALEPVRPAPPAPPSSGIYERQILTLADRAKRYPSSREARLTHPEGTVGVWVELDRQGKVIGVGVEHSSHSNILDQEALKTLRQIAFPPFPEGIYPGETSHRFIVNMKYEIQKEN